MIVLTQQMSDTDCKKLNLQGHNNFPLDVILDILLFGGDHMREDVDATIVLGEFGLE